MKAPALPKETRKRSPLRTVVTIVIGAAAALGALILAGVIWFFAACANNPECLKFG